MAFVPDAALSVVKLESYLICSICLETINDPRTLPCFHSFCKGCLAEFVKQQREKVVGKVIEDFDCPTCRSVFTLKPNKEVEGMSGSHLIRNMLEVMAIQYQAKVVKYSGCAEKSAICHCTSCELIFMCEKCLEVNKCFADFRKHTALSIDQLNEPGNQAKITGRLYCEEHKNKPKELTFYCETCKELICRYCMDFKHITMKHSCFPIEKVAEEIRKSLETGYCFLSSQLELGNQALQTLENTMQDLKKNGEKIKYVIDLQSEEVKKKITEKLEEIARTMKAEVDQIYNKTYKKFAIQSGNLKAFVNEVKGSVDLSKYLLENGNSQEILSTQSMFEECVEKIKNECPADVKPINDGVIQYRVVPIDNGHLAVVLDSIGRVAKI